MVARRLTPFILFTFYMYLTKYSFQAYCCFPTLTIVKIMDNGERGMNSVAMTIINAQKTRCVCETLMPPKHPSFEKHDPDILL